MNKVSPAPKSNFCAYIENKLPLIKLIFYSNIQVIHNKDPSIEAIEKQRKTNIENIYTKNLRPILDKQETNVTNPASNQRPNSASLNGSAAVDRQSNNEDNSRSSGSAKHKESSFQLQKERTDLSYQSSDSDLFNERETYVVEDEKVYYENLCRDLKIVPCSIILKSLATTQIILCNYGLNSTGCLALANALKNNVTVTKLDLSGNEIGYYGVKHLVSLFEDNSTIVDLVNLFEKFICFKKPLERHFSI